MRMHRLVSFLLLLFCFFPNKDAPAQSNDSTTRKSDLVSFKENKFWKGSITVNPHSNYFGCGLAHDGSFLLGDSGNLKRIDFKTGKTQILVHTSNGEEYAFASVVSPDNQQVAFYWFNGQFFDLKIAPSAARNGVMAKPRLLIKGSSGETAFPYDWSPDGKWILVRQNYKRGARIALVSPKNGSTRILKDLGTHSCTKMSFSPNGRYIAYDYAVNIGHSDIRTIGIDGTNEQILKDSATSPWWSPDGKYVFYLAEDRQLFNLWGIPVSSSRATGSPVLIKEGIGYFSPLGFIRDGSFLYGISSPTKLNVYLAEFNPQAIKVKDNPTLVRSQYPDWNVEPKWSPDGKYLAYNSQRENNQNAIVIRSVNTDEEEDMPTNIGSIVGWFPDNSSLFIKRQGENGSMPLYRLSLNTKDTSFLFDLKSDWEKNLYRSLPVLSGDGKTVFYIESDRTLPYSKVFSRDIEKGTVKEVATFDSPDITSFSASPDGKYLGMIVLYQKEAGRPSALKVVSLASGEIRELFKEPWGDATKFFGLGWSPDGHYIYYIRSNLNTSKVNLWRVPLAGDPPMNTGITMTDMRMPNIHPDGKRIAFAGGEGWYRKTYEVRSIRSKD